MNIFLFNGLSYRYSDRASYVKRSCLICDTIVPHMGCNVILTRLRVPSPIWLLPCNCIGKIKKKI